MGHKHKRKSEQGTEVESLKRPAEAVTKGELSVRKAAVNYGIQRTSLQRYLSTPENSRCSSSYQNCKTSNQVFTQQVKMMLAQHIRDMDHRYHGIGPAKARELTLEFAKQNKVTRMPPKLGSKIMWEQWQNNEKIDESGTVLGCFMKVKSLTADFLCHTFVKRSQDAYFKFMKAEALATSDVALLHIDFAENY